MRKTSGLDIYFFFILCAFASGAGAAVDSLPGEVRELASSTVMASPSSEVQSPRYLEFTSADWAGRGLSLPDLLSGQAGIQTRRTGGMGSFQTLSIRGMGGNQIVVCIDGVPLTESSGGAIDLGSIDLGQYERVEVYKGQVPARFGGNGAGGAINLVSREAGRRAAQVDAFVGSHSVYGLTAQVAAPWSDSLYWNSSISLRSAANDYEFTDRNGTLYNKMDDRTEKRQNAEFSQMGGNHALRLVHAGGRVSSWRFSHSQTQAGLPGREDDQTVIAGSREQKARVLYRFESAPSEWGYAAEAFAQAQKSVLHWYYPLDKMGMAVDEYMENGVWARSLGARAMLSHEGEWSGELQAEASGDLLESRNRSETFPSHWEAGHSQGSLSARTEWKPASLLLLEGEGQWRLSRDHFGGGSFAHTMFTEREASDVNRQLGSGHARATLGQGALQGYVSAGRYFRAPQPMEMFGVGQGVLPNTDLKPEVGLQGESGLSYQGRQVRAVWSVFATEARERIVWLTSGSLTRPENLGRSRVKGMELQIAGSPWSWLSLQGNATWQDPRDISGHPSYDGLLLPDEPVQAYASEALVRLPFTFELRWNAEARSRLYRDRANRQRIPAQSFHHLALSCSPLPRGQLTLSLRNLGDAEYQDLYAAWPTPGRTYMLAYTQDF